MGCPTVYYITRRVESNWIKLYLFHMKPHIYHIYSTQLTTTTLPKNAKVSCYLQYLARHFLSFVLIFSRFTSLGFRRSVNTVMSFRTWVTIWLGNGLSWWTEETCVAIIGRFRGSPSLTVFSSCAIVALASICVSCKCAKKIFEIIL